MRTLGQKQADHFLYLHRNLILFTNKKYKICNNFQTISDIENLDQHDIKDHISPIRKKMYHHDNIQHFCQENPYKIGNEDLLLIEQWKNNIAIDGYIVTHLATHTVLMATNNSNTLYGIKGITTDLSDMMPKQHLPIMGQFVLLPFMGSIIYDGFCDLYNMSFGSGMRRDIKADYNHNKALNGIYYAYNIGDDLSKPPPTATVKEMVRYSISKSLERGEFPQRALDIASSEEMREVFEKEYTARHLKFIKRYLKMNKDIPKMYYAAYRESVIGVMASKKDLELFCNDHHKKITKYITIFAA